MNKVLVRPKILVLHALQEISRNTTIEFTGSFGRHAQGCDVHYLNVYGLVASRKIEASDYDLLVVTYEVLAQREWVYWPEIAKRIARVSKAAKTTILLPQDDYAFSSRLDELACSTNVSSVWSPISNNVELLYPMSSKRGVRFKLSLTGYLESAKLAEYSDYSKNFSDREIDLGQRVSKLPTNFGEIAQRKAEIATELGARLSRLGFRIDVSTKPADSFYGTRWLEFLGNTRFTVSRKGGAGLGDPLNKMANRVAFLKLFSFVLGEATISRLSKTKDVVEGDFSAISPRLFEAAALGVCQILEEDDYLDGALVPWVHYVPLKSDFSNIHEIAAFMRCDEKVEVMVTNARKALIDSGSYSYHSFVQEVLSEEIGQMRSSQPPRVLDLDAGSTFSSGEKIEEHKRSLAAAPASKLVLDSKWRSSYLAKLEEVTRLEAIPEVLLLDWKGIHH